MIQRLPLQNTVGEAWKALPECSTGKAKQIGCKDTYFITPNGLDAEDENGKHHTTAKDLALIMRYAVKNETFLHIAQTRDYTFSEITGKRTFSVHNANAFLDMRDGVLAGKTGYTSQAGYSLSVCALGERGQNIYRQSPWLWVAQPQNL